MSTQLDYLRRKDKNTIRLARHNAAHVMLVRQFDPQTGEELATEQIGVDVNLLKQQRDALQAQVDQMDVLIADLEATTVTLGELLNGAVKER